MTDPAPEKRTGPQGREMLAAGLILSVVGLVLVRDFFVPLGDRLAGDYVILGPFILAAGIVLMVTASPRTWTDESAARIRFGNRLVLIGMGLLLFPLVLAWLAESVSGAGQIFLLIGAVFVCWIPGLALLVYGGLVSIRARWRK